MNPQDWVEKYCKKENPVWACSEEVFSMRFGTHLGAPWKYGLSKYEVIQILLKYAFKGDYTLISIVCMPRFATHILNGEIHHNPETKGIYMYFSFVQDVMRKSLEKGGMHAQGLQVNLILKQICDPSSYDMIMDLLEEYPESVIEFTVFDRDVGVIPHRNTVIWEVRNY